MQEVLRRVGDPGDDHDFGLDADWHLRLLCGSDERVYTLNDLKARLAQAVDVVVECVSSGKISSNKPVTFTGVRFADLIADMAVPEGAQSVIFRSKAPAWGGPKNEKHTTSLEWEYCINAPDLLITWAINGEPLAKKNGGPLRTTVGPDRYFYKALKWLEEIEISTLPMDQVRGTWETYGGYHNLARTALKERFEPMMRWIDDVQDGVDKTRLIAPDQWVETFEQAYAAGDLSRLVVARMHEMDLDLARDFRHVKFVNGPFVAKLRGTYFQKVDFSGCVFRGVNFSLTRFKQCQFGSGDAAKADFRDCDFEGTHFYSSDLCGADMRGAYVSGAFFYPEPSLEKARKPAKPALVQGLDLRGFTGYLDDLQRAWLLADGARLE